MTTDPQQWFLASQALDHHDTVSALTAALPGNPLGTLSLADEAEHVAAGLARMGYALVRLSEIVPEVAGLVRDLTEQVDAAMADRRNEEPGFLARKED